MMRRWQWWLKWLAMTFACTIAVVWVWSRWHGAVATNGSMLFLVGRGLLMCSATTPWHRPHPFEFQYLPGGIADAEPGWAWGIDVNIGPQWGLAIPLWLPFVIAVALAAWLWHLDRRPPSGCCARCGYDLTGIAPGACPECGRVQQGPSET